MSFLEGLGAAATLLDVYRRHPALARHVLGLAQAAFALTDELSRAECELVGAYASALNGCAYCRGVHGEAAAACGLGHATQERAAGEIAAYGGARWAPVFAYVRKLTLEPHAVAAGDVAALRREGWSEACVVQLAALCGLFGVLNRLVDGLGLAAGEEFYRRAGQRLASIGYDGTAELLGVAG